MPYYPPPASGGLSGATSGLTTSGSNAIMNTNNSIGVGAYALLKNLSGGSITNAATSAGSGLYYAFGAAVGSLWDANTASTGTWRNISGDTIIDSACGIFIRTA